MEVDNNKENETLESMDTSEAEADAAAKPTETQDAQEAARPTHLSDIVFVSN